MLLKFCYLLSITLILKYFFNKKIKMWMEKSDGPVKHSPSSHMDQDGTDLLSFHCWEREVIAALWSQPHALPSALGTRRPKPSPRSHGLTLSLERASQKLAKPDPAIRARTTSQHLKAPTWVRSPRYWARRFSFTLHWKHKILMSFNSGRCGIDILYGCVSTGYWEAWN